MEEFMYSTWFGNDIYVSPNGNVYCMYHFDDIKYLRSVTVEDVYKRLLLLDNEKTVLSVINPKGKLGS